jgi:hypothetical protein
MRTLETTKIDSTLQDDLTQYGLIRKVAEKAAPVNAEDPTFFGVREKGQETELIFGNEDALTEPNVQISVAAPELEPFDMLTTKDFKEAVKKTDPKTLREFIAKLVDDIKV